MKLSIVRQPSTASATMGSLYIDGHWFCFTLEDPVRELGPNGEGKIPGKTAIPYGRYQVIIDKSTRFNCLMPHILNVPHFEGIRIHSGNTAADTEGCVLLGLTITKGTLDSISSSKLAFGQFFERLKEGLLEGEVWVEVKAI